MTRLTHLDIDVATLVETDIKVLPASRELDIAIATLDGDGHFLALGTSTQATNICLHQNLKRRCNHLTLHEWHLGHILLHYNLSVLQGKVSLAATIDILILDRYLGYFLRASIIW